MAVVAAAEGLAPALEPEVVAAAVGIVVARVAVEPTPASALDSLQAYQPLAPALEPVLEPEPGQSAEPVVAP